MEECFYKFYLPFQLFSFKDDFCLFRSKLRRKRRNRFHRLDEKYDEQENTTLNKCPSEEFINCNLEEPETLKNIPSSYHEETVEMPKIFDCNRQETEPTRNIHLSSPSGENEGTVQTPSIQLSSKPKLMRLISESIINLETPSNEDSQWMKNEFETLSKEAQTVYDEAFRNKIQKEAPQMLQIHEITLDISTEADTHGTKQSNSSLSPEILCFNSTGNTLIMNPSDIDNLQFEELYYTPPETPESESYYTPPQTP